MTYFLNQTLSHQKSTRLVCFQSCPKETAIYVRGAHMKKHKKNAALRPPTHCAVSKVLEEFMNVSDVIEAWTGWKNEDQQQCFPSLLNGEAAGRQATGVLVAVWVVKIQKEVSPKPLFQQEMIKREMYIYIYTYIVLLTLSRWNMCQNTQLLSVGLMAVSCNWGYFPQKTYLFPFHVPQRYMVAMDDSCFEEDMSTQKKPSNLAILLEVSNCKISWN